MTGTFDLAKLREMQRMVSAFTPALRFVATDLMTVAAEDWSKVRSPGRARRRRAKHPQRIRYYQKPDPSVLMMGNEIIGHPVTLAAIRAKIQEKK